METRFPPAERHPHRLPPVVMVTGLPEVMGMVPAADLAVQVAMADTVAVQAAVLEDQAVVMVDTVVLPVAAWAVIESFEIRRNKQ